MRQRSKDRRALTIAAVPPPDPVAEMTPVASRWRGWWVHGMVAVLLAAVCAVLYAWTADFPMVFDDYAYLITNPLVKDAHSLAYLGDLQVLASLPARMGLAPDLITNFILRPVAYATFHLNYLFDGFHPRWFRVVNMGVHAANGLLIYALVRCLLERSPGLQRRSALFIAVTTALLFVAHPLATESVTYIVQRFTSLGAFFYLLTLWLHFAAGTVAARGGRWAMRGASVIVMVLGMLTKECCFTGPLVLLLLDCVVVRTPVKRAVRSALPLLLCLPLIPCLVMLAAWAQNNGVPSLGEAMNVTNLNVKPWGHWEYLVTQSTVVVSYLRRLVWPAGLNLDPEWPLYQTVLAWPVLRALGVITALLGGSWALHRRYGSDVRWACLPAFTLWFFLTVGVSSGLVPLPDLMAEHRCYLPSVGVFVVLACLLDRWRTGSKGGFWLAPAAAVLAVCALGGATWQRNQVWSSPVALWEDTSTKSPGNSRAWGNLGDAYSTAHRYEDAARCFQKAVAIEPRYETAYVNLISVLNAGHHSKAVLDVITQLARINKDSEKSPDVQCNRSIAMIELGEVDAGIHLLKENLKQHPEHLTSHMVLGMVYSQTSRPRQAMEEYQRAVSLQPADPQLVPLMRAAELAANATVSE